MCIWPRTCHDAGGRRRRPVANCNLTQCMAGRMIVKLVVYLEIFIATNDHLFPIFGEIFCSDFLFIKTEWPLVYYELKLICNFQKSISQSAWYSENGSILQGDRINGARISVIRSSPPDGVVGSFCLWFSPALAIAKIRRAFLRSWIFQDFFSVKILFYCRNEICNPEKKYFGVVGSEDIF